MKKFAVLMLIFCICLSGCRKTAAEPAVMTCGEFSVTNTDFAYYYWTEVHYYYDLAESGEFKQFGVDMTQPLDAQMYDETTTWQDHMTQNTIEMVKETMALVFAAQEEGFAMPESYETSIDEIMSNFSSMAAAEDKKMDDYLQSLYGKGASEETFRTYLGYTYLASAYADELYSRITPPTQEQVEQYHKQNLEYYGEDGLEKARKDLQKDEYNNAIARCKAQYPFSVNQEQICITAPEGLYK